MIDRILKWLAYRPFSRHRWVEDIYARAELRRWDRIQKAIAKGRRQRRRARAELPTRKARHPKLAGPAQRNHPQEEVSKQITP